jgi:hypothetical protein
MPTMTVKPTNPANIITDPVIFVFLSFPVADIGQTIG